MVIFHSYVKLPEGKIPMNGLMTIPQHEQVSQVFTMAHMGFPKNPVTYRRARDCLEQT